MAHARALTRSGMLEGESLGGLEVYRGVPYAQPPRGPMRWQGPQPVKAWSGVRRASSFGASSPQSPAMFMLVRRMIGVALREQSQDCLYLNVWTPSADAKRRPVLFWIHGGAFIMGSGSTGIYDGAALARSGDVVVVTINYRLGALGFLNLKDRYPAETETNLGVRDQVAALEWVRDNIDGFGGDPENVTIFGESAGGMSVGTLLGVPVARGLFHRAIAQSGATHHVSSPEHASRVSECFLDEIGTRDFLDLEEIAVSELVAAQQRTAIRMGMVTGSLPWQPYVDGDLIPEQPLVAIAAGRGAQVPLITGTNRDEWKLFMWGDRSGRHLEGDSLRRRIERILPEYGALDVDRTIAAYQGAAASRGQRTPTHIWLAFQSDRIFHYPAHCLAHYHSKHVSKTFAYLFDWSPPFMGEALGACHGLELPFVFGSHKKPFLRPLIGIGRGIGKISNQMMSAWLAFAHRGDPNQGTLPSWPSYESDPESESRLTLTLGRSPQLQSNPFSQAIRFWKETDALTREAEAASKPRSLSAAES